MRLPDPRVALFLLGILPACPRDPVPSPNEEACVAACASVACIDPDLDEDVIERCESYCLGKFDASEAQGPACAEAFADSMMCLGELSCSEYDEWLFGAPGSPCPSARTRVEDSCEQIFLEPHILPPE